MKTPDAALVSRWSWKAVLSVGAVLLLALPLVYFRNIPYLWLLLAMIGLAAVPFMMNVETVLCLTAFYMTAFEIPLFKGIAFPISVNYFVIDAGLVLVFLLYLWRICIAGREDPSDGSLDRAFFLFFLVVVFSFILGLMRGNDPRLVQKETRILLYYATYFVAVRTLSGEKQMKFFSLTLLAAALLSSLDSIYTYRSLNVIRFVSRQIHMVLLVTPFLIAAFLLDRRPVRRAMIVLALVPIALCVVASQTRGTWVAMLIAVLIALTLGMILRWREAGRWRTLATTLVFLGLILAVSLKVIGTMSTARIEFVGSRLESISHLETDYSMMMRAQQYLTVADAILKSPWLGNGLGSTATYRIFGVYSTQNNVDSTYLTMLWKMGFLGLVVFLVLYWLFMKRAFLVYRHASTLFERIYSTGVLSAMSALLILGVISPVLMTYRFNFIFGILFAMTDRLAIPYLARKRDDRP